MQKDAIGPDDLRAMLATLPPDQRGRAILMVGFAGALRGNRIEIMFGRLKDWRLISTRYAICPKVFRPHHPFSAIAQAHGFRIG